MADSGLRKPCPLSFEGNIAENWRAFEEEFCIYCEAALYNKSSKVQAYTLLNLAGPEGIKRSNNFEYAPAVLNPDGSVQTPAETKEDMNTLLGKFRNLCNPQTNVSMERHLFFTRDQKPGESVDTYMTDLKLKAATCEFGTIKDSLIRDRFISGVTSDQLRRVLLKERNLELHRAIEIAQLDEITQTRLKQFSSKDNIKEVNDIKTQKSSRSACYYCGHDSHHGKECPAKGKQCRICGKYGHFSSVCKSDPQRRKSDRQQTTTTRFHSRPQHQRQYQPPRRFTQHRQHDIYDVDNEQSEEEFLVIETIDGVNSKDEIFINLSINSVNTKLKVDTGAKCNVIDKITLENIAKTSKQKIVINSKNKVKLIAYGGNSFYTIGTTNLSCVYMNKKHELLFNVIDKNVKSIIGLSDSLKLNLVSLGKEVFEIKNNVFDPLVEYTEVFEDKLGKLPVKYKITMDLSVSPVTRSARKLPLPLHERVKQELDKMCKNGVISPITEPTDWVSNIVAAKKKDKDEIRLCIDPKDLNTAIQRPRYPLKNIDDVLARIPNARVFSVLDAKCSFWQIPLDNESSKLTTFATPFGRYKFNRLPYGIIAGSEVFQQSMDQLFQKQPCEIIIDDILVWGENNDDHDKKLKAVLNRCREVNLKLNVKKCKFRVDKVYYVGHELTDKGVAADSNKVQAITDMPSPSDVKGLQRFLGMVNYLSKFIPGYSQLTAPLRELLHKNTSFVWLPHHDTAFKEIKKAITQPTILKYYDVNKEVTITCDASKDGLGAACLQENEPIHFVSRAMTESEIKYAQIEKELLAAVFATEKFKHYIYGKNVTLETDHKPLISIMKKSINDAPTRLQKLMMRLQKFDVTFVYKQGKEMHIADALSRAFPNDSSTEHDESQEYEIMSISSISDSRLEELKQETLKDKTLQGLFKVIVNGWPEHTHDLHKSLRSYSSFKSELVVDNGIIYKSDCAVIPYSLRKEYLQQLHRGHMGTQATINRAKHCVYWSGIQEDIETYVQNCVPCMANKSCQQKEKMLHYPVPNKPYEIVATDIFEWNSKLYLVTVDSFSGWYDFNELSDLKSSTVIQVLKNLFSTHGIPCNLYTDNGPQYTSFQFKEFCQNWSIVHITSSPYYHQSNGLAERAVRSAKELLQKCHDENSDIYLALLNVRNVPRSNLGTPAQRLLSRNTRTLIPSKIAYQSVTNVPKNLRKIRLQKAKCYDKNTRPLPLLQRGDVIRVKTKKGHRELAVVKRKSNEPRSYIIEKDGKVYRRNRRHLLKSNEDPPVQNYWLESYLANQPTAADNSQTVNSPVMLENQLGENVNEKLITRANIITEGGNSKNNNIRYTSSGRQVKPPIRFNDYV